MIQGDSGRRLLPLLLFLSLALCACRTSRLPGDDFPISFWCGPPEKEISLVRYQEIKDAGFNILMPPCGDKGDPRVNQQILDMAEFVGLKAYIFDSAMPTSLSRPEAVTAIDEIVESYRDHPAFAGYFIADEPGADKFRGLGQVVSYLHTIDPKHPAYINLFPNYATAAQMKVSTYEKYVKSYVNEVHPPFISYDHYHYMKDGTDRPGFFENLDMIERIATDAKLPFWQIVGATNCCGYRTPTEAEKRMTAMQTLAYGGRGLMYFHYWTPRGGIEGGGVGIIDDKGRQTRQYEEVKRINSDVRQLADVLMLCSLVQLYRSGTPDEGREGSHDLAPMRFPKGTDVTVSIFTPKDEDEEVIYALAANRDTRDPIATKVHVSTSGHTLMIQRLEKSTGIWETLPLDGVSDENLRTEIFVRPGDAELFRWVKAESE